MINPFHGTETVCQFFYSFVSAFNRYYFQTIIVIQMYMLAGYYYIAITMLKIRYPIKKFAFVMIVNYGYSAGYKGIGFFAFVGYKFLVYQINYRF